MKKKQEKISYLTMLNHFGLSKYELKIQKCLYSAYQKKLKMQLH